VVDREIIALLSGILAFLMSWLVQPHFRNLGFLTEIVDHPGYRRSHREPVPRTGGMAIFISFFFALFILERLILPAPLPWSWLSILIGAGMAILALGVGDDRFGIHAEKKLYGQLIVILGLMILGQRLDTIVLPHYGRVALGGWAWPFTLLWYLGFINSMNLIDGLDGLASGISVLVLMALAAVSAAVGEFFSLIFSATLGGATLAFFYWNISARKIFLGDSGSMWMGLVLGTLILHLSRQASVPLPVLLAPMVVPIWDTGTTIFRRSRKRASIFQADDYHLHHRLVRLGFSTTAAVAVLLLLTAGTGVFALSDFLKAPWLGLPALGCWLWALTLGASQHRRNRLVGLDSFTEFVYVLGFDDRLEERLWANGRQVAEIVDLQAERARVERAMAAAAGSDVAPAREIGKSGASRNTRSPARDVRREEDVLLPSSQDLR
jgi:UDP-GlcNAc:undecaprenyl-phosphate GlcNAc-1-phosphate transferase